MTIYQGNVSLTRYRLVGPQHTFNLQDLNQYFAAFQARKIRLQGVSKEESVGWIAPLSVDTSTLAAESNWDLSHCQTEEGFMLRLRLEKRKVQGPLLQHLYRERLASETAKRKGKAPTREGRQEIKDALELELLEKTLPSLSFCDGFWKDRGREVFLFSTSKKVQEIFAGLFTKTFAHPLGLTMVRVEPPLLGLSGDAWQNNEAADKSFERLALTIPSTFLEHRAM